MSASGAQMDDTCLIRTLATPVAALRGWGYDVDRVLGRAELRPEWLDDHDRRITLAQFRLFWDAAKEETGDEALGLHVLEAFDPRNVLSTYVYLASSSATPREAFERVSPFIRLSHSAIDVELHEEGGRTICRAGFRGFEDDRTLSEYFLGLVLKIAPAVVGSDTRLSAWFRHPEPPHADEYEKILGVEVRFDAPFDAVIGSASDLDRPLPKADAILCELLERQASDALARMPRGSSFADVVRHRIEEALPRGELSAEGIARGLGLSPRTLRRRLSECDVSYQQLLDGVRCERARAALAEPGVSVGEVAFALGFSDASAFHKAFRRWTGMRPSEVSAGARD